MTDMTRDGRPGWDPEHDAELVADLVEFLPTVEDEHERLDWQKFLQELRARQRRHCGRRWPEEEA